MAEPIELEFVSSTAAPFKTEIRELYIPAFLGKAGVLENHLPYISLIKAGEVYYKDTAGKNHYLYIREGFLEAADNKITLISDTIEKGEDLDNAEIEARLAEVNKTIKDSLTLRAETAEEWLSAMKELEDALESEKEYKTKLEIINKLQK